MIDFIFILIILYILLTLIVVLLERKLLAYAQRRFGPSFAGRNGWLQVIVDLLKLASKNAFVLPNPLTSTVPSIIFLFFTVQLLFVQNFVFLPSGTFLKNIDGLIFFHLILIMIGNLLLIILGFLSQSRYSLLGVLRAVVHVVSLDTFITVIYILLLLNTSSGNFHDFSIYQFSISNFLIFFPAAGLFLIILLLEAKRSPFDHAETESEVVAGYATEYAGIFLLTFYLIEYFHLIIAASHIVILFLGGWNSFFSWVGMSIITLPYAYPIIFI